MRSCAQILEQIELQTNRWPPPLFAMNPKAVFLPHANLQYSQLHPSRRPWVVRHSYEPLFDLVNTTDGYRIGFEASGISLKIMAEECPGVLAKLQAGIRAGRIEPVASPYTHIMLANIDPEIGLHSLKDGLDAWERYTGVRPVTGWNPECSWAHFLPGIFREAGFENLIMDADSLLLSFAEVRDATGLTYDVRSHSNKNKLFLIEEFIQDKPEYLRYLTNPTVLPNGLRLIGRSDMMANPMLWYLMGATEGHRDKPIELSEIDAMMQTWRKRIAASGSFIMPYAEDAEYIGTSAYFYVKQFNEARFFEPVPDSVDRFRALLDTALANGYELDTPAGVIAASPGILPSEKVYEVDNGIAWHGGTAKAWANTHFARLLDPVCRDLLDGIRNLCGHLGWDFATMDEELKAARVALTNACVSDCRWPPLPTSPGRFNVEEAIADLKEANHRLRQAMERNGLAERKSLHSYALIESLILSVEAELMDYPYFGEKSAL